MLLWLKAQKPTLSHSEYRGPCPQEQKTLIHTRVWASEPKLCCAFDLCRHRRDGCFSLGSRLLGLYVLLTAGLETEKMGIERIWL